MDLPAFATHTGYSVYMYIEYIQETCSFGLPGFFDQSRTDRFYYFMFMIEVVDFLETGESAKMPYVDAHPYVPRPKLG